MSIMQCALDHLYSESRDRKQDIVVEPVARNIFTYPPWKTGFCWRHPAEDLGYRILTPWWEYFVCDRCLDQLTTMIMTVYCNLLEQYLYFYVIAPDIARYAWVIMGEFVPRLIYRCSISHISNLN